MLESVAEGTASPFRRPVSADGGWKAIHMQQAAVRPQTEMMRLATGNSMALPPWVRSTGPFIIRSPSYQKSSTAIDVGAGALILRRFSKISILGDSMRTMMEQEVQSKAFRDWVAENVLS